MRILLLLFFTLPALHAFTQGTGPGGCGTSANNVLWLNANKGVSVTSGQVTQWNDQSGNGNHALPAAATNRPAYVTGSVNGNASLGFDGTNDELQVAHHASLNLTQWHIFIVIMADLLKDYNGWIIKGNDGNENYEMLSYSNGNIHTPIYWTDGTRTAPNSSVSQVTTSSFDIFEYTYSASTPGRRVWKNYGATTIYSDAEAKTPSFNSFPVYIGNERNTTGRFVNGDIAEVIIYNGILNSAQKIIVNNYLSAKYNRTLGTSDIYIQDNPAQGNYDYDVLGIGRVNSTNMQTDSRGSGIVRILNPGNLNDNEFFICGHDNATLGTWGSSDFPAGLQGRWFRTWRVSEVNASGTAVDVGSIDIHFDLTGLGPVTASQLRLLVDTDNDGVFNDETPISGATNISGNIYGFTGVTAIGNNMRFTLGTTNISQTPLPVELLFFNAAPNQNQVDLAWATASEANCNYFTVERSADAQNWHAIVEQKGMGKSSQRTDYSGTDPYPLNGLSYYRLKQVDNDGVYAYSQVVPIQNHVHAAVDLIPNIYPNPLDGHILNIDLGQYIENQINIQITDLSGKCIFFHTFIIDDEVRTLQVDLPKPLARGMYLVEVNTGNKKQAIKKLLVE